jgi:LysM repeat protein
VRVWTKSACVVLAWSCLIVVVAAGMKESVRPAQANIRIASGTTQVILASTLAVAAARRTAARPAGRYVVQPGDTLSGIAARLAVRGGWPALYAANRRAIGPDPNTIRPGTVLTVPHSAVAPSASGRTHPQHPAPTSAPPVGLWHHPQPVPRAAPAALGMPQWLKTTLLVVGLLILVAFLVEPVLVVRRRRQQAAAQAAQRRPPDPGRWPPDNASVQGADLAAVPGLRPAEPSAETGSIVLADHDRLVVTCNQRDDTVYVLRPPGEDPKAILRVARLVLPEGRYGELARQLGMPAIGPVE